MCQRHTAGQWQSWLRTQGPDSKVRAFPACLLPAPGLREDEEAQPHGTHTHEGRAPAGGGFHHPLSTSQSFYKKTVISI